LALRFGFGGIEFHSHELTVEFNGLGVHGLDFAIDCLGLEFEDGGFGPISVEVVEIPHHSPEIIVGLDQTFSCG
jgi:hypothetical protein